MLVARFHGDVHRAAELRTTTIVKLIENADGLRRPQRFEQLLAACACDFHGRLGWADKPYLAPAIFMRALAAVRAVDAATIVQACSDAAQIPIRLHEARVAAVKQALSLAE